MHDSDSPDGYFDLYYRHGWAYLVVHPPASGGVPVYYEDVQNRMKILGVPRVSATVLRDIVEDADEAEHALVEWPEGARLASGVAVVVAQDGMSATVEVAPPKKGAAPPTVDDLVTELDASGVVFGVDRDELSRIVDRGLFGRPVVVATGREPVHGRAARVEYYFDTNRGRPYLEMDFGRINLKELNFIEDRDEGELLARLLAPVPPKDGKTVTGSPVYAEDETSRVVLRGGANTRSSPDGSEIYAACDGNVRLVGVTVVVEPVVTVENVNYETGNIDFEGSVVVEQGIADGFVVKAGGDVQVGRGVGRATIEAGGNVLLKTGINGGGEGRIVCRGNLFAKYIESCTVKCESHVFVEEAIMHSHLFAWKHCVLNGRRGEIIASNLIVGGSLWCKKLGGIYEAPTHVAIGIAPDLLTDYRSTKQMLEQRQERFGKVELQLDLVERAVRDGRTDERTLRAREQLSDEKLGLENEIAELKKAARDLRDRMAASRESMLVVEDTMYKGASVTFGRYEYHAPDKGVRKTIIRVTDAGLQESGYNPAQRPTLVFDEAGPSGV